MLGEQRELEDPAQVDGGEVSCGQDQNHHRPKPFVAQQPDVLNLVALLDEADRLLDPPAGEIALDEGQTERRDLRGRSVVSRTSGVCHGLSTTTR